jgi:DNA-binding transcriptional ArsR family regulator
VRATGNLSRAPTADLAELEANARRVTMLLKAMANPTRLMVLCQIAHGERSVGELQKAVGLGQSALSQHLAVLRRKGLVTSRRCGQTILYSLSSPDAAAMMSALYEIFCGDAGQAPPSRGRRVSA